MAEKKDNQNQLTPAEAKAFAEEFLRAYLAGGFGSMPKRELDVLAFHLITRLKQYRGLSTYDLANALRVSERRVKGLRLESALRYAQADHQEALRALASRFFEYCKTRPVAEGGYIQFALDDPVVQREFEQAARALGFFTDTSFNREIIKVPHHVFVAVFASVFPDVEKQFTEVVRKTVRKETEVEALLDAAQPFNKRVERFLGEHTNKIDLLSKLLIPLK